MPWINRKWENADLVHPERKHIVTGTGQRTCKDHGAYTAQQLTLDPLPKLKTGHKELPPILMPFWTHCPSCNAIYQTEDDERRGGMTQKQRLRQAMEQEANLPERFKDSTIWNWQHGMDQQRRVWDWARDYASQFEQAIESGRSGVFCGAPGTGKTHLAVGMLRHIIEKGGTGYYTTVMDMLGRIKDTFHKNAAETEQQVVTHLHRVSLLVIDEVGRQLDSNYEMAQLFRILDKRYRDLRPTLLVSNLTKEKLGVFLGDAVADRMREAGGAVLVFDWVSQRSSSKKKPEEPKGPKGPKGPRGIVGKESQP